MKTTFAIGLLLSGADAIRFNKPTQKTRGLVQEHARAQLAKIDTKLVPGKKYSKEQVLALANKHPKFL